jgi:hypothetical protein
MLKDNIARAVEEENHQSQMLVLPSPEILSTVLVVTVM